MVATNLLVGDAELFGHRGRLGWVKHPLRPHQIARTVQCGP